MTKLILLSLSLLVFYIQFQTILACPAKNCDPGYACCVGKECDEGKGGKCYRSCNQIPPSMQEIGSFPAGKIHIQRVLTLCEFVSYALGYFISLVRFIWLFLPNLANANFG